MAKTQTPAAHMIRLVDCETGEIQDRPATPEELAQIEADQLAFAAELEAQAQREAARAQLVAALLKVGLSAEAAAALGL